MSDIGALDDALSELGALCRCEMTAVESYDQALLSPVLARFAPLLRRCRRSHQERTYLLSWRIYMLGGSLPLLGADMDPAATEIEGGLSNGEKAALAALEAREERAVWEYRERIAKLDADSRDLVESQIFRAQLETHIMMRALKRELGVAQAHAQL